jgi:hypothetical protein
VSVIVTADIRRFEREVRQLGERFPVAAARALNRTMATAQTRAVREIAADTGLAQREVRKALDVTRATPRRLLATLAAASRRLVLTAFKARPVAAGVTYSTGRGRRLIPGAFIATMRSGHVGVFKRLRASVRRSPGAWSPNLPIDELRGPSIQRVALKILAARLAKDIADVFPKNLAHEVSFLLRGRGRPAA